MAAPCRPLRPRFARPPPPLAGEEPKRPRKIATMIDIQTFAGLLETFTQSGVVNDGARFAALFTETGTYADDFFGLFRGRAEIAAMLQRFHDTGADYRWDFCDLVTDGTLGYATFRFSFCSKMQGYEGKPVLIAGISCFRVRGRPHRRIPRGVRHRHRPRSAWLPSRPYQTRARQGGSRAERRGCRPRASRQIWIGKSSAALRAAVSPRT